MKEQFPYEKVEARPSVADPVNYVYRPVIPITIFGLTLSFSTKGLLDTGGTESVLPRSFVDEGLVDPAFRGDEKGVLFGADGSPIEVEYGTVDLSVRLRRKTHRWHAKVAFSPLRNDVLLGDAGFLRYFSATFNRHERYTTLRPVGVFPRAIMPAR